MCIQSEIEFREELEQMEQELHVNEIMLLTGGSSRERRTISESLNAMYSTIDDYKALLSIRSSKEFYPKYR
ncbi:hypothetical protein AWH56_008765 [Anaerobacillus isosaccharinicus]|uniref:Uncharacterized protein n=1 Tax=Anaerobacillus isosaccharinicus TaxID=1532552 RepID=A0A1S2L1E7_9BACI|nr:hypothetical protein [Anaerobacillus isosaccharinicus]MBA5588935.1 hypothetical protein [Anaerobacillus isosaccharinicus]QOY37655.1 hypothetical protein AWH56_008765 [Anaerobacillus isosaccharinicus]